jgi:hypothetical protein
MIGYRVQHELVLRRGPQPGSDRHPGWTRHRLHPTPLTQPLDRHNATIPATTDKTAPTNTGQQTREQLRTRRRCTNLGELAELFV